MGAFFHHLKKSFGFDQGKAISMFDRERAYRSVDSIAPSLPWMEYDASSKCFLLQDGLSAAAMFEIEDVACESTPEVYLNELRDRFQGLFQTTIPQESHSPWHLQFFLQDELSLDAHVDAVSAYVKPNRKDGKNGENGKSRKKTAYTQEVLDVYAEHCRIISKPGGLFVDHQVTGYVFQGRVRRIRLLVYRMMTKESQHRRGQTAISHLNTVAKRIQHQLESADVIVRRCGGQAFYEWMVRWFNPSPGAGVRDKKREGGKEVKQVKEKKEKKKGEEEITPDILLKQCPYPGDDQMPFGYDFVEQIFKSTPVSDHELGVWYFDGQPHQLLTVQSLSAIPKVGHISAEKKQGKKRYSLFDGLPEGSVFVMNVVIEHQTDVINHVKDIYNSCAGNHAASVLARQDCQSALYQIEQGNYLLPTAMGVYVRGKDLESLHDAVDEVKSTLSNHHLNIIDPEVELTPCDAYLRFLPMAFDYAFDKCKGIRRSRFIYARQVANLVPLYGRYRGSSRPGIKRFNRGGEPFCFDPFHKKDKSANSHMLYLAETGGGKSASLVWDLMCIVSIYNPRVFIIEAGDSFSLFCEHAKKHGQSVNQVKLSRSKPVALNPFADAFKILDQKTQVVVAVDKLDGLIEGLTQSHDEGHETNDSDDARDILGEMVLATQLMITGGDVDEIRKFTRANRTVVLEAIIDAADQVRASGREEMIAEDVVAALVRASEQAGHEDNGVKRARIQEMADSMRHFTTDQFSASFFNRVGKAWPDTDITRLDMGLMKRDEYSAQLALAVMGMLNRIAHIAETTRYEDRMTIVLIDEAHILTKNPLTAASLTQFSKMSRKLGMWLWLATQNMADFPDESKKMLSMIEFWIGLGTSESEIDEMRRFKQITDEEKELFLSVHKEIPNYVEGVVMSRKIKGLFRNVPPRIALALGMTDPDEAIERGEMMKAYGITELEAAERMAESMKTRLLTSEVTL